jgi:hypothetical protein
MALIQRARGAHDALKAHLAGLLEYRGAVLVGVGAEEPIRVASFRFGRLAVGGNEPEYDFVHHPGVGGAFRHQGEP